MNINLEEYKIIKGSFAVVVVDSKTEYAFKIFKSYDHPDYDGTGKQSIGKSRTNEYYKNVFETEATAYELAQNSETLKKFTPLYFGKVNIDKVFDNGNDVTYQYLKDCCFKMNYIQGDTYKLLEILNNPICCRKFKMNFNFKLEDLMKEFKNNKINYLKDATAITQVGLFKIIDFAKEDSSNFQPIIESNSENPYDEIILT